MILFLNVCNTTVVCLRKNKKLGNPIECVCEKIQENEKCRYKNKINFIP